MGFKFPKAWRAEQTAIPHWAALSLTGLYLAVIFALGATAIWSHRRESRETQHQTLARQTFWLARAVNLAGDGSDLAATGPELRWARYEPDIERCDIVDRQGRVLASSHAPRVGTQIDEDLIQGLIGVSEVEATLLRPAEPGNNPCYAMRLHNLRTAPAGTSLPAASTQAAGVNPPPIPPAWLVIEGSPRTVLWPGTSWWTSVGCVALAALAIFWLVYRIVSRSLRPLAAIRHRLLSTADCVSEQLALLRLNDSMDQSAAAWNRLIEFTHDLQQEVQSAHVRSAVGGALDAYRSERLTAVLHQIPHGVLIVEEQGQISFANRSAARMLGRQEEELTNSSIETILPENLRTVVLSPSRGTGRWIDHTLDNAEGSTTLRFINVPLDKELHASGSVILMQDVSQFKEMERAQDAFLYHVTHELRTPLTNIRAYAETLSEGVLDDPSSLRECYNVISGETERLSRLVEAILNVSQLEVGTARLNFGEVYVDRLIRDTVQDAQAQATTKNIDLRLRLPPKLPPIRGDKERLSVVMANLVGNAIKYTPAGGQVEITCNTDPDVQSGREPVSLRIAVSDTGFGIDPSDHEKIFEKFYRVRDERVESEPGTGLGLAIARETIRLHGGNITVESTPGRGSTFHVALPVRSK